MRRFLVLGLFLLFASAGCDSGPTAPGGDVGGLGNESGTISARIDGTLWTGTVLVHANRVQNVLSFGGGGLMNGQATSIAITIIPATGPGTVTFGPGVHAGATLGITQAASWSASSSQGSGTVTLTTLDDERVAGTFQFVAEPNDTGTATGTRTVTDGQFNIRF